MADGKTIKYELTVNPSGLAAGLQRAREGFQKTNESVKKLDVSFKKLKDFKMEIIGLAATAWGIERLVTLFANFEHGMRKVNTIAEVSRQELGAMGDAVKDIAVQTGQKIPQLEAGLYDVYSSFFGAGSRIKILNDAAKAAVAGETDLLVTGKAVTGVLNAMGGAAEDSTRILDQQFKTVKFGVLQYRDLAEQQGMFLSAARGAGQNYGEVMGGFALLTKVIGNVSVAATSLNQLFMKFKENDFVKTLSAFGISNQENGRFRSYVDVLSDLNDKMKGLSETAKAGIINKLIPDSKSQRALLGIMNNFEMFREMVAGVARDSAGAFEAAFNEMSDDEYIFLEQSKRRWEIMLMDLGEAFVPLVNNILPKLLDGFEKTVKFIVENWGKVKVALATVGIIAGILKFKGVVAALGGVLSAAGLAAGGFATAVGGIALGGLIALIAEATVKLIEWRNAANDAATAARQTDEVEDLERRRLVEGVNVVNSVFDSGTARSKDLFYPFVPSSNFESRPAETDMEIWRKLGMGDPEKMRKNYWAMRPVADAFRYGTLEEKNRKYDLDISEYTADFAVRWTEYIENFMKFAKLPLGKRYDRPGAGETTSGTFSGTASGTGLGGDTAETIQRLKREMKARVEIIRAERGDYEAELFKITEGFDIAVRELAVKGEKSQLLVRGLELERDRLINELDERTKKQMADWWKSGLENLNKAAMDRQAVVIQSQYKVDLAINKMLGRRDEYAIERTRIQKELDLELTRLEAERGQDSVVTQAKIDEAKAAAAIAIADLEIQETKDKTERKRAIEILGAKDEFARRRIRAQHEYEDNVTLYGNIAEVRRAHAETMKEIEADQAAWMRQQKRDYADYSYAQLQRMLADEQRFAEEKYAIQEEMRRREEENLVGQVEAVRAGAADAVSTWTSASQKWVLYGQNAANKIRDSFRDVFVAGFKNDINGVRDVWNGLLDYLKESFLNTMYELLAQKMMSQLFGMGGGEEGGDSFLSSVMTLGSFFSGGDAVVGKDLSGFDTSGVTTLTMSDMPKTDMSGWPTITGYATGGVGFKPSFGKIFEAGPEAVIPLSNPRAVAPIVKALGGGGGNATNVNVTLNLSAMDGPSAKEFIATHGGEMMTTIARRVSSQITKKNAPGAVAENIQNHGVMRGYALT